ncbi:tRNA processing endoribonuclease Trz1 [Ophiocordyceps camponoti-floridani]|uniref:ribonuclease Z n=1 Tax=Ophiocordyceps camponoti-floridani TaxID=2030778 RepID=A0A8H4VAE8_9HYPO|nr:tRNA processing endoribonuclease Trz1 [Ophiocordyceps camponoti-floridani]
MPKARPQQESTTTTTLPSPDTEIIPLGTGSSTPSKHRNVSATLIRIPSLNSSYLLDCGEGTLGQLRRALGPQQTSSVLSTLRLIVISHLHADHHLGTLSLLLARDSLSNSLPPPPPLSISCISRYRNMLRELSQAHNFAFHTLLFPNCPPTSPRDVDHAPAALLHPSSSLASVTRIPVPTAGAPTPPTSAYPPA